LARDEGHDCDSGFEAGKAQGETREEEKADGGDAEPMGVLGKNCRLPIRDGGGMIRKLHESPDSNDGVQEQVDGNQENCNVYGFAEAFEEDEAQDGEEQQGDKHLAVEPAGRKGIVNEMG